MFVFKSKVPAIFPKAEEIKDEKTKEFGQDLARQQSESARSMLDDMKMLEKVQTVDSLPVASEADIGKLYLRNGTGVGAHTLFICLDTGSSGYAFKQITLS